jgi:hypothetical protein
MRGRSQEGPDRSSDRPAGSVDQRRPEEQQNEPRTDTTPAAPAVDQGATFVPSPEAMPATSDVAPTAEATAERAGQSDNLIASRPTEEPSTPTQRDDPAYGRAFRYRAEEEM